ncbi:MAG: hypothetical protein RIR48_1589 [Bacteroidota bacterium]
MKLLSAKFFLVLVLVTAPIIYLKIVYDKIPEKVAVHFGADMQPDRFGDKSELWNIILILTGVSFLLYILMVNLGKIDPKNQSMQSKDLIEKIGLSVVTFLSLISIYIIYNSYNPTIGNFIFILLGGFFAFLGNFMYNVKPNYFVGIRLPWTLENEDNWRKTHHLGGKIWVIGGLLIILTGILLSPALMYKILLPILLVMVLIPVIFSYRYYEKSKN